jgi:hypothetical protein
MTTTTLPPFRAREYRPDELSYDERARLSEVLMTAAHLVVTYGHARRKYGNRAAGYCVSGAILTAGANDPWHIRVYAHRAAARAVGVARDAELIGWNDAPSRQGYQVVDALMRAHRAVEATL